MLCYLAIAGAVLLIYGIIKGRKGLSVVGFLMVAPYATFQVLLYQALSSGAVTQTEYEQWRSGNTSYSDNPAFDR